MSEVKWTKEQERAIYEKDKNILVAAAAGSGKTAVLVERILNKILDEKANINIDELLVVTFTNAAASEMKERLLTGLYKKSQQNPKDINIQKQMLLLNKANITTIHSFCLEVIRNNFFEIDIDPNFKIADTTEIEILKLEALEDLFEKKYEEKSEQFINVLNTYTSYRSDEGLKELILEIFNFIQSCPFPFEWLDEKIEMFNVKSDIDFAKTVWGKILKEWIITEITDSVNTLKSLSKKLSVDDNPKYLEVINIDINELETFITALENSWDKGVAQLENILTTRLTASKTGSESLKELTKKIRAEVKEKVKNIKTNICVSSSRKTLEDINYMYKILKNLETLVIEFSDIFKTKKREKNMIDFNDIEHYALKILVKEEKDGNYSPTHVAKAYREKFKEILIDEYQDSNIVQEYILSKISNGNNLFMVGDVKQSIYRFRQARPDLFLSKYEKYDDIAPDSLYDHGKKIKLFKNFRSRSQVLDIVNEVFESLMTKKLGELDYTEEEFLNLGANYEEVQAQISTKAELNIIDLKQNEEISEDEDFVQDEPIDNIQLEAKLATKRIKELVNSNYQVLDKKTNSYRKIEPKDIVILLRSTKNYSDIFLSELNKANLPAYSDSSGQYLNSIEISLIISILKIIDNPMQDIPLIAVLRSYIGGFTDDELVEIRLIDKNINFFEALEKKKAQNENNLLSQKIDIFLDKLHKWQEKATYMKLDLLIWDIYDETGYYSYVSSMPDGQKRAKNLRMLFERAGQYEKTSLKGLFNFIKFIDKLILSSSDLSAAKVIGENDNVIRIMSIHKSKGLEFPVVFLSGTGKKFNMQDLNKNLLMHQEIGLGPDYIDEKRRIAYPTLAKLAIKQKSKIELLSEELRILYVGLTRAKEKLIITGIEKDFSKVKEKYEISYETEKIPSYRVGKAQSFMSWFEILISNKKDIENILDINTYTKEEIMKNEIEQENDNKRTLKELNELINTKKINNFEHIQNELSWEYKNILASKIPTKMSITELKRKKRLEIDSIEEDSIKEVELNMHPKFLQENYELTNAQKGTVMHEIIQYINLKKDYTYETIRNEIEKMVESNILTNQEAKSANISSIYKFTQSNLCKRIRESQKVYKEKPFYLSLPVKEVYKQEKLEENILLQGIIDCYFEEDDEIVLIDYKTDYVPNGKLETLVEKYKVQLEYYKKALEQATGKKVKETYIYSLALNKEILI